MARYRAEDREAVLMLRQRGLVPLAIGPELGMPDSTVAKHLRELEREGIIDPIPPHLSSR
jgi:predicted transcriptional regulator